MSSLAGQGGRIEPLGPVPQHAPATTHHGPIPAAVHSSITRDIERLMTLFHARHPCIAVLTDEEDEALDLVRSAAMETGLQVLQWSITQGVRDALITKTASITDSEHPAGALYYISTLDRRMIVIMLDVVEHLKDARTMRLLRET